jgi:hypothetical protein
LNECRRQGYLNGTCRSYVVDPDALVCDSNEVNIGQIEDCKIESGLMGVGKTCCCGTDRIITQLTVAQDDSGNFSDIQSAIDYAVGLWGNGVDKTIYVKNGTYEINNTIVIPDNTKLVGLGNPVIKIADLKNLSRMFMNKLAWDDKKSTGTFHQLPQSNKGIQIKGFTIDGNKAKQSGNWFVGLWFLNIKDTTIENCEFKDHLNTAFTLTWYSNIVVNNVTVRNCGDCGVLNNCSELNLSKVHVADAIYIDRGSNFFLKRFTSENNYAGIDIYLSNNVYVENCIVKDSIRGINLDAVNDSKISNCVVNHCTKNGIALWGDTNVTVMHPGGSETRNNTIIGCNISNNGWLNPGKWDGIDLSHNEPYEGAAHNNTIENNLIYDNQLQPTQRYAIGIGYPTDDYNIIRNNYYWGNINNSVVVGFTHGIANNTVIEGNINHPPP